MFDVSEFMRSLQSAYARWYNQTFDRRGRFWADRFKSVVLEKGNAVLDCMLYVDLNPIRAGLVVRPEDGCINGAKILLHSSRGYIFRCGSSGVPRSISESGGSAGNPITAANRE